MYSSPYEINKSKYIKRVIIFGLVVFLFIVVIFLEGVGIL